jgi:hypothetical protein
MALTSEALSNAREKTTTVITDPREVRMRALLMNL